MKEANGKQLALFETKENLDYYTFLKDTYDISQADYENLLDGVVIVWVNGCKLFIDTVDIY